MTWGWDSGNTAVTAVITVVPTGMGIKATGIEFAVYLQ